MTSRDRTILLAAVTAAVLGFAAGWFARVWTEPTLESRAHDAAERVRDRFRELAR